MKTIIPGPLMRNMENLAPFGDGLEDAGVPRDCMNLLSQTRPAPRAASTPGERPAAAGPT